ncbi:MAG: Ig-like domain-containing protein [Verrucomicrobiota bacterium]
MLFRQSLDCEAIRILGLAASTLLVPCLSSGEISFLELSADGQGDFPWHQTLNWDQEVLPTDSDVVQIGNTSTEVHCHIKGPGAVAQSIEISEYGLDGGFTNTLTLTDSGTLDVSSIFEVGKDKHGVFVMEGGLLTVNSFLLIGSTNRGSDAWGTMEIKGGTATARNQILIGRSRFAPTTSNSSLILSGGSLNAEQNLTVDSIDRTQPGIFLLEGDATYQQVSNRLTEVQSGVMEIRGNQVSIDLGDLALTQNTSSKLIFSGNGVSTLRAQDVYFSSSSQLDVSGLTVGNGKYVLVNGETITNDGIFFTSNVDRNLWHLEVDSASGDLCLTRGNGPVQHDLLIYGGSGSGMYATGTIVPIQAAAPAPGLVFDTWEGSVEEIDDLFATETTFTMGSGSTTITAIYKPIGTPHTLTVYDGSGQGEYGPEQVIPIQADQSVAGRTFARWLGDSGIADPFSPTTTYTMPNRESVLEAQFYQNECHAGDRGYRARPCGLDLNNDGEIGEDGVDNILGRNGSNWNWLDPDGDGDFEDYFFVDSFNGNDSNPGTKNAPLKTIQAALDLCDGAANGIEDIICIYGIFGEEITLTQSGKPGHYTRPDDHFEFPADPMRIIGWDKDEDGEYPPYDKDDQAVIDGSSGLITAIYNDNKVSYVEIAHLSIHNFQGWSPDSSRGAIRFSRSGGNDVSHIYVHDVEMKNINTNTPWDPSVPPEDVVHFEHRGGERIVATFWNGDTALQHIAMCNILVDGFGDFFARGAPANGSGNFRFQNMTLNCKSFDGAGITGFKIWGAHENVEILDSIFDGRPGDWSYGQGGPRMVAIRPDQRNVTVRNNLFLNARAAVTIDGCSLNFGPNRTTDNVVVDSNHIITTHDDWGPGGGKPVGIRIEPGCDIGRTTEDIAIVNNFIHIPVWGASALILSPGMTESGQAAQPGTLTVAHNTIWGPGEGHNFYGILIDLDQVTNPQRNFLIKNNLFANIGSSGQNIAHNYNPSVSTSGFSIDGNIWSPGGVFIWKGERMDDFADWQSTSGQDSNSIVASPLFANTIGGDLHLAPEDNTTRTVGVALSTIDTEDLDVDLTQDIDGDLRENNTPWAGADKLVSAHTPTGQADAYFLNEDHVLKITSDSGVLLNDGYGAPSLCDTSQNHGPMALLIQNAVHGSMRLSRDGSFTYIPDPDYFGNDQFSYRLRTPENLYSLPITVDFAVSSVNDAPVAVDDRYRNLLGEPLDVSSPGLLANDADVENDTLAAVLISPPLYAQEFQLNPDGSFHYLPLAGVICEDRFIYAASDGSLGEPATVTLNISNIPSEIVLDEEGNDPSQGSVSQIGTWLSSGASGAYNGASIYSNNDTGNESFTWTPNLPVDAVYRVYARWTAFSTRSPSVTYTVHHAEGSEAITLSQKDVTLASQWVFLGEYSFDAGSEKSVTLSSLRGEQINADAIRWERTFHEVPEELIVDNLSSTTSSQGSWGTSSGSPAFHSDSVFSDDPGDSFSWDINIPEDGQYGIYAWWTHSNGFRSDQVPYRIIHDGGIANTVVDQSDPSLAGQWNHLGDYTFAASSNGQVIVTVPETGSVKIASADAIRLVRIDGSASHTIPPNPSGDPADLVQISAMCFHEGSNDALQVEAILGATYILQRSLDLSQNSWTDVESITALDERILLSTPHEEGLDKCFYRIKIILPE